MKVNPVYRMCMPDCVTKNGKYFTSIFQAATEGQSRAAAEEVGASGLRLRRSREGRLSRRKSRLKGREWDRPVKC